MFHWTVELLIFLVGTIVGMTCSSIYLYMLGTTDINAYISNLPFAILGSAIGSILFKITQMPV
jgi:replication initiation and membrane attachment protein DnaB